MAIPDIQVLANAVPYKLYQHAEENDQHVSAELIGNQFSPPVSSAFVENACELLDKDDLIHTSIASYTPREYRVSTADIPKIKSDLTDESSFIARFSASSDGGVLYRNAHSTSGDTSEEFVARPPMSFSRFKEHLLIEVAKHGHAGESGYLDLKAVADHAGLEYLDGWVRKAAQRLSGESSISTAFTMAPGADGGLDTQLTGTGLERAGLLMKNGDSPVVSAAPAADRIVELNHNSSEYIDTIEKFDEAIEEIDGTNEYDDPEEKEQVVAIMRAGRALFNKSDISVESVQALVLAGLNYLARNFSDHYIVLVIKAAIAAISGLLGLTIL